VVAWVVEPVATVELEGVPVVETAWVVEGHVMGQVGPVPPVEAPPLPVALAPPVEWSFCRPARPLTN
jgi:hypothetical protein